MALPIGLVLPWLQLLLLLSVNSFSVLFLREEEPVISSRVEKSGCGPDDNSIVLCWNESLIQNQNPNQQQSQSNAFRISSWEMPSKQIR